MVLSLSDLETQCDAFVRELMPSNDPAHDVMHIERVVANARRFAGGRLPRAVADPVGGSDRRFRQTYDEIDRMVAIIGMRLFGASWARTG